MGKDSTLRIQYDTAVFNVVIPAFFETGPVRNSRKLLALMYKQRWRNEDAIATLRKAAPERLAQKKAAWHDASIAYQNEWRDPKFARYENLSHPKKYREILDHNKRLTAALKKAKSEYEKMLKICVKAQGLEEKYYEKGAFNYVQP